MTELVCEILPEDKPRYLMGVGTPVNILECIALGIDMFDCVMPSRNARHGMLFTSEGTINIKNNKWRLDFSPLDPNGTAYVDHVYTKAYLNHLIKAKENLAIQIATIHNLAFYLALVKEARKRILDGTFTKWKDEQVVKLGRRI
jgi:queuine tRNA-ribosyltransferase